MPIRMKTLLLSISLVVGFAGGIGFAQSMGPAAFAARQHIKDEVLQAMNDGKISATERIDILSEAKEILNPQEYAGLVRTIKRLSSSKPGSQSTSTADIAKPHSIVSSQPAVRRFISEIPYVEESQLKLPPVRNMLPRLTYVKPPEMSVAAEADRVVARLPKLYNTYLEPPSWIKESEEALKTHKTKTSPQSLAKSKTKSKSQPRIVASEIPVKPKKSVQNLKGPSSTYKQVTIKEPEMSWKIAERPIIVRPHIDYSVPVLTTPAAAQLYVPARESDPINTIKVSFDEPIAPEPSNVLIRQ
jgi:hypothetical protein